MSETTHISWTDSTFNPWIGCTKVDEDCKECYAEPLTKRFGHNFWGPNGQRKVTAAAYWRGPLQWNRKAKKDGHQRLVFCGSMCDVFEDHPTAAAMRPILFELIRKTPFLTWQLLTKRPENISTALPADWGNGWPNVWLGTSIGKIKFIYRRDWLVQNPAVVHFISYEPALGPLDELDLTDIEWVIYGGESGPGRRPEDKQWARDMYRRCQKASVSFWHKQSSALRPGHGVELDGRIIHEFPKTGAD